MNTFRAKHCQCNTRKGPRELKYVCYTKFRGFIFILLRRKCRITRWLDTTLGFFEHLTSTPVTEFFAIDRWLHRNLKRFNEFAFTSITSQTTTHSHHTPKFVWKRSNLNLKCYKTLLYHAWVANNFLYTYINYTHKTLYT